MSYADAVPSVIDDNSDFLSAAFSAALERPVVTYAEYERRKHEPQFANVAVETIDVKKVGELSFEPVKGKFGDVYGESGNKITINVTSLTGVTEQLEVGCDSYVEEIKYMIPLAHHQRHRSLPSRIYDAAVALCRGTGAIHAPESEGEVDRLVLLHNNQEMQNGHKLSEYGVRYIYQQ